MSLVKKKRRPLERDKDELRDAKYIFIACDDTYAPKQYFESFKFSNVRVYVVNTTDGTSHAKHVLERLLHLPDNGIAIEEGDELWMVLDVDHCLKISQKGSFTKAINEAVRRGIHVAISNPCFEYWLLLHCSDEGSQSPPRTPRVILELLKRNLPSYKKNCINSKDFPFSSVRLACDRAKAIQSQIRDERNPERECSQVYLLVESIINKCLKTQIPYEFVR